MKTERPEKTSPAAPAPPAHRRALELIALQRGQAREADQVIEVLREKLAALFTTAAELDAFLGRLARAEGLTALAYEPHYQVELAVRAHAVRGMPGPVEACMSERLDRLEREVADSAKLAAESGPVAAA